LRRYIKERYPIRDYALLARSGTILGFVLMLFFLHPVLHFEPAYAAVFGAITILLMGSYTVGPPKKCPSCHSETKFLESNGHPESYDVASMTTQFWWGAQTMSWICLS